MNTDEPDDNLDDNGLAYAAISLCGNQPHGEAPQWHELTAWHEGTLAPLRSEQVLSHIANDPACFQQWLDVVEAQSWVEEEALLANTATTPDDAAQSTTNTDKASPYSSPPVRPATPSNDSMVSKIRSLLAGLFQQPLPVYGGAFAAILVAVLVVPLLNTGQAPTLQQQMDRSMDTYIQSRSSLTGSPPAARSTRGLGGLFDELSVNDVERGYLQSGMLQFNQQLVRDNDTGQSTSEAWQALLSELSDEPVNCDQAIDSEHCVAVAEEFTQLGQWAIMNVAACQTVASTATDSPLFDDEFWSDQYALYQSLIGQTTIANSQLLGQSLSVLSVQSTEALCNIASTVISASQ